MRRRTAVVTLWALALGLVASALQWAGHGALAGPPLTDPGRWAAWLDGRDPALAAFSLLRIVALAGLWYVVVVTAIGSVLRVAGAASLVRITDRFTVAPIRRLLAGSVSLGLAASGIAAVATPALRMPVAAAQAAAPPGTDTPPATVTMRLLGPTDPPVAPTVAPPEVAPAGTTARWTVEPGECFWSIAEDVLTERWGRAPTDAEVVPYWQRLIEANRHELAHGNDPDLIFPGQVFEVPTP
ncbi:MAG: LysM peptidoglycan-binding domain-containing protein [Acidimicrobiales bacterium]